MLDIADLAVEFDISRKKLRKLERAGYLNPGAPDPMLASIRASFKAARHLSVVQLIALIDRPELLDMLSERQRAKAREQLAALGDVEPWTDWGHINATAAGEEYSVQAMIDWAKATIPVDREVSHHYLAVRLLLGVPAHMRHFEAPRLPKCFVVLRRHKDFAGWWTVRDEKSWYHRPKDWDL